MEFAAIDFETTGYEAGSANEPWQLGVAIVSGGAIVETREWFFGTPLTKWGPWTDTLKIAKTMYPGLPSYRLGDLCTMLGAVPDIAGRTWHDGLYDAVACALLAMRLGACE